MLNSTLGMDIWIGMAESAWICPECETTATHKQGKGKKSTLMGGQEKKCMDGQRKKYTWMAGWKYMYRKIVTNVLLFTVFFIFILGYANI